MVAIPGNHSRQSFEATMHARGMPGSLGADPASRVREWLDLTREADRGRDGGDGDGECESLRESGFKLWPLECRIFHHAPGWPGPGWRGW